MAVVSDSESAKAAFGVKSGGSSCGTATTWSRLCRERPAMADVVEVTVRDITLVLVSVLVLSVVVFGGRGGLQPAQWTRMKERISHDHHPAAQQH